MAGLPLIALTVWLFISAGESQGFTIHTEHSRITATVGGDAFFNVKPSAAISGGNWVFNGTTIVQWAGTGESINHSYKPRVELFTNNGSLLLKSVKVSDSGEYRVDMTPNSGSNAQLTIALRVFEPVSQPNITPNATSLIEYYDTVALTCFASGTAVSYLWLEDNGTMSADDRFELSADNRTLTISGVLRTDGGFTCHAYNLINGLTSDPFDPNVYYGPDLPNITINPDTPPYISGSSITLTCSAESRPAAGLQWHLNGASLEQTGQQLSVTEAGNYTCQAFNNITKKYNASTVLVIVLEPVSSVTVTSNNTNPVENKDTIVLTCDAQGTVQSRTWFKNNLLIQENERILTSSGNTTLTITHVDRTDTGTYKCEVSNDYNSESAEIHVQVNYGPDNVRIKLKPSVPVIGSSLTLTCSALSVPTGEYEWYNWTTHLQKGPNYTIQSVSSVHSGNYTCRVHNSITMKSRQLTIEVTVEKKINVSPGGLSPGAIAGIVIGAFAGVAIVAGLAAWLIKTNVSRVKGPGIQNTNRTSGVNNTLATNVGNSSNTYENIPRNQNVGAIAGTTNPLDENSTYMGLNLEDRAVYNDLRSFHR